MDLSKRSLATAFLDISSEINKHQHKPVYIATAQDVFLTQSRTTRCKSSIVIHFKLISIPLTNITVPLTMVHVVTHHSPNASISPRSPPQ